MLEARQGCYGTLDFLSDILDRVDSYSVMDIKDCVVNSLVNY